MCVCVCVCVCVGAYYFRAIKCLRVEQIEHTLPFFEAFIDRWTIVIPALKPMASLLSAVILAIALCHVMSCLLCLLRRTKMCLIGLRILRYILEIPILSSEFSVHHQNSEF